MSVNRTCLPTSLYTVEQTRVLDNAAITEFGIPGLRLMQRAGHAVFAEILMRFPHLKRITVACGAGNNGGDGFVVALLALQKGIDVQLICVGERDFSSALKGEALAAWQQLQAVSSKYEMYQPEMKFRGELLVDAMLGTGLAGEVRGLFCSAIYQFNMSSKPVVAMDVPSGLCADTGRVLGMAVRADITVSFIGMKRGLLTSDAVDYCGQLLFDDLKVPDDVYDSIPVTLFRTTKDDLNECLPRRSMSSHKGKFGHVLVIGGNQGLGGAALLASESAMRSGAGLVTLATRSEHVVPSLSRCPEVMVKGVESGGQLKPLLDAADVLVLGPGLGQNAWAEQMLLTALASGKRTVLDADALNLMAKKQLFCKFDGQYKEKWLSTPHPGEAARLLNISVAEVEQDRFRALEQLQSVCGGAVVLKGAGSLVSAGEASYLCDAGNPGMSVGGMGDVLSGVCGAFLAQGLTPENAARVAVFVHAKAADYIAQNQGEVGMLASDLLLTIPKVINGRDE